MKKLSLLFLLITAIAVGTQAQGMLGVNLKVYQTKGDFNKNVNAVPFGISFNYLHRLRESKLSVGAELGVAMYANNQYDYELPSGGNVRVDEEDCFWTLHADVRYYFYEIPGLKAYAQGRVGMTTFFSSRTPVELTSEFRETFEFHGTAFNVGAGGGVLINFGTLFNKEKKPGMVSLDLGASIHSGSKTDYRFMQEGSQSSTLDDGTYQSVTNYIDYRLGVIFNPSFKN
jgi:hypothetical protein